MASIISAGTTSGTALNLSGDTSGTLQLQTQAGANTITVPNATGTIFTTADVATQANQETATSTTTLVTPARQQYHPSAVKAWVRFTWSGGTPTIGGSYNVTSLSDSATGQTLVTVTTAFSAAGTYGVALGYQTAAQASQQQFDAHTLEASSFSLRYASNGSNFDNTSPMTAIAVGDQ